MNSSTLSGGCGCDGSIKKKGGTRRRSRSASRSSVRKRSRSKTRSKSKKGKKVWTPQMRREFAEKMRLAREAKGNKKRGKSKKKKSHDND